MRSRPFCFGHLVAARAVPSVGHFAPASSPASLGQAEAERAASGWTLTFGLVTNDMPGSKSIPACGGPFPEWLSGRVQHVRFEPKTDQRGTLLPIEMDDVPFPVRRLFVIAPNEAGEVRGGHGHRDGRQLLVCLDGEIEISLREGEHSHTMVLRADGNSLLIEAGVWSRQTYADAGSRLLVLSDQRFEDVQYLADPQDAGQARQPE